MMDMNTDFKGFIALLNEHAVEYLIVGGYAVGYHGHPRFTQDLDLWVRPEKDNAQKLLKALAEFGFPVDKLSTDDFINPDSVFQMGQPPYRVDILNAIAGLKFANAYKRRIQTVVDGMELSFLSRSDLIKNKRATGRKKDLGDVEHLQKLPKRKTRRKK